MALELDTVDHLLSTTRAVRRKLDLDRPVPDSVITECLRLAIQAPTAGNIQNWRWMVVRDAEQRAAIAKLFRTAGEAYLNARAASADPKMLASGRQLVETIERVPVFVIPCLVGRPPADAAGQAVFYGSIFPAVWSFQLALRSRGLGSTLTSYHLAFADEAAKILGIPAEVTQVGLLPVAYTTAKDFGPAPRTPVEEITYWDSWDNRI